MTLVIKLKKRRWFGRKELIVVVVAVILTTGAIKASDNYFNSESKEAAPGNNGCPADMVFINTAGGGFCIDKFENSASPDCPYQNPASQGETRTNLDSRDCKPASLITKIPWRFISQDQAAEACAKAGKRLPTNEEWLQASLGTPDPESNWTTTDCQVNNNWQSQPGLTGAGKNCVSSAGANDMIGNVWEWTDGKAQDGLVDDKQMPASGYVTGTDGGSFPASTDPDNPDPNYNNDYFWMKETGLRAIARGGYWRNQSDAGKYSVYIAIPPSQAEVGIGFRCVK